MLRFSLVVSIHKVVFGLIFLNWNDKPYLCDKTIIKMALTLDPPLENYLIALVIFMNDDLSTLYIYEIETNIGCVSPTV